MEGDGRMPAGVTRTEEKLDVAFDRNAEPSINNIHDRVMLQILQDSLEENDEPLRLIERLIWDPEKATVEFDVKDLETWRLVYSSKPPRR